MLSLEALSDIVDACLLRKQTQLASLLGMQCVHVLQQQQSLTLYIRTHHFAMRDRTGSESYLEQDHTTSSRCHRTCKALEAPFLNQ